MSRRKARIIRAQIVHPSDDTHWLRVDRPGDYLVDRIENLSDTESSEARSPTGEDCETSLKLAIKETARVLQQHVQGCEEFHAGGLVLNAAKAVAAASVVEWCEKHRTNRTQGLRNECEWGAEARRFGFDDYEDCQMVRRLLVVPPG